MKTKAVKASSGQAWAAKKNQELEARSRIVRALKELRIEHKRWPAIVQKWHTDAFKVPTCSSEAIPPAFQPPSHERLLESITDWKKRADLAWRQHRDRFIGQLAIGQQLGMDEKIDLSRKSRGPGKSERDSNVPERWNWAALRLLGQSRKQIASDISKTSAVR